MLAILGGSGLTEFANLRIDRKQIVRTPFGEPSGPLTYGHVGDTEVVFLARHGYGHTLAPHEINYRANLWALHSRGVTHVLSVCTVGGITADFPAGAISVPDQIIDYTWGRKSTFFEGAEQPVVHVDFTHPYCGETRSMLLEGAAEAGVAVFPRGTYAAVQGPRLETAAEIDRLERDGADLVGMTGMPEAVLARELGLPYAVIGVVANHAAGRGDSVAGIHFASLEQVLQEAMGRVRAVIEQLVGCQPAGNSG
jgi:5'-methylthioinosine phosphorylase